MMGDFIMNYTKTKKTLILKKYLIDGLYIVIGCMIMAIGTALFLLPNQLSSGGFAGISTIIYWDFNPIYIWLLGY